ncbi:hypothetical protein [Aliamphritea spongicola]|nr:hypothetical protein [Aliamphritea spongicola]
MNEKTAIDEELDMTDADTEDTELSTAEKDFALTLKNAAVLKPCGSNGNWKENSGNSLTTDTTPLYLT